MNRTWIVVADAAQARLFEVPEPGSRWQLLADFENPEGRARSRDFLAEENGGIQQQEGAMYRNAMEPLSIKKVEAARFARELALMLEQSLSLNRYDRLILVAAPEFLGLMRKALSASVDRRLIDTIPKDYAKANARELESQLGITHLP